MLILKLNFITRTHNKSIGSPLKKKKGKVENRCIQCSNSKGWSKRSLGEGSLWCFGSRLEELEEKEGVKKIQWCCHKVIGLGELSSLRTSFDIP